MKDKVLGQSRCKGVVLYEPHDRELTPFDIVDQIESGLPGGGIVTQAWIDGKLVYKLPTEKPQ